MLFLDHIMQQRAGVICKFKYEKSYDKLENFRPKTGVKLGLRS